MRKILFGAVLILFSTCQPVHAEPQPEQIAVFIDGEDLTKFCRSLLLISRMGGRGTPQVVAEEQACVEATCMPSMIPQPKHACSH